MNARHFHDFKQIDRILNLSLFPRSATHLTPCRLNSLALRLREARVMLVDGFLVAFYLSLNRPDSPILRLAVQGVRLLR
jgi:hypothetical protein